ncbi:alpha/beta fold hydrolase [Paenibacillus aquistagni]|uniref:alpha/beta fold hydrolase n=1 Tax=Paenibacillus aquistagni TaxID=1852522 RepID=UPI000B50789F|nr:alpha/beta hydrolase [Paenibacillus aquistagni]NMM51054.1 alpha/beta hydrolase [Paenibacillus aquistagni]
MNIQSHFLMNGDVSIHFLDSVLEADSSLVPLLISPGLSETAEEYTDMMERLLPRRVIVLSYRGRGQSDTPISGYTLEHHMSDLEAVVEHARLEKFHLYGYSRGVSYAIGYAEEHQEQLESLMLADYPAVHKRMESGWAEAYIHDYLIPHQRTQHIRQQAVRGIARESEDCSFEMNLNIPVLVLRGLEADSLVSDQSMDHYRSIQPKLQVRHFPFSGHDIRRTEPEDLYATIETFIAKSQ